MSRNNVPFREWAATVKRIMRARVPATTLRRHYDAGHSPLETMETLKRAMQRRLP